MPSAATRRYYSTASTRFMAVGIVINPISGATGRRPGEAARRRARAAEWAARAGVEVEVVLTDARGHGASLAREFVGRGWDVVAWGGDGTVNEVAGALIGTSSALGVVPSGSGDGLARSIGLPLETDEALQSALSGSAGAIDVGYLGDRHFLNIAGIGFDAAVGVRFNREGTRGVLGYARHGLTLVWSYAPERYRLTFDGRIVTGEKFLIGFANGREYGNHLVLAPDADAQDGWLDVVVVDGGSPLRELWRARRLGFRSRQPAEGVHRTRVRIASVSGERLVCHVDGETFETSGELQVRIEPGALRVRGLR